MRKLLISVAIATATLAAVPAAAQYRGSGWNQRDHDGWRQRGPSRPCGRTSCCASSTRSRHRIERSAQRGIISQREAISLRREANQIRGRLN